MSEFTRGARLLGQAGLSRALAQHRLDLGERDTARFQDDEEMVEQVGRLGDHAVAVLGDRRDHGLDRLLAQLLGAMGDAAIEKLAGIGDIGGSPGSLLRTRRKVSQG